MLLQLVIAGISAHAATINWTNTANGNWNTAANWNPNTVPGAADTAIISLAGVTVFLNSDTTVGSIILGTNGPGTATLNWSGGVLSGSMTIATNGILNIGFGGVLAEFNGFVLTNYGTVNWTNTDIHGVDGYNQQIYNYGGWNAQSDNAFLGAFNNGPALFENFGTFRKSGTSGVTTLDAGVQFINSGQVQVQSGALALSGGINNGGTFGTASGSIMDFSGCLFTNTTTFTDVSSYLTGDTTFAGIFSGTLNWLGNDLLLAGSLTVATNGVLNIVSGGVFAFFQGCVLTNYARSIGPMLKSTA